jgi:hypothetical protein
MEQSAAVRTKEIYRSAPNGDRWLLAHDAESGMSPIFRQVARSLTLISQPFSSRLAAAQRSKNFCA